MSTEYKRQAAQAAVELIADGMILGLGTGSTADIFLELLAARIKDGLQIQGISSSDRTTARAEALGIPLSNLDEHSKIDLTIDGADEFDGRLNLIKGGGGALLREKVIASCSRDTVIIADSSKRVDMLGAFPLPVEVVPMAARPIAERISSHGRDVTLRRNDDDSPYKTENGNYILDCAFRAITSPSDLDRTLSCIAGVVEHGLFIDLASRVFMGSKDGLQEFSRV